MRARRIALAALGVALAGGPADAATVRALSPAQLLAGADLVVDGEVRATRVAWRADRAGLETIAKVRVDAAVAGDPGATVDVAVPGGALEGVEQRVAGAPRLRVGDRARLFLVRRADGTARIYGWDQGRWPARTLLGRTVYVPAALADREYTTNGMVWPASAMPVPYLVHTAGSDDVAFPDVVTAVDAAFATWAAVPCSSLRFVDAGTTTTEPAVDGVNVIRFVESGWIYGAEAAGATSLWIVDGQQTADISLNGEQFHWAIAPPGAAATTTLDLQAVLTHEIGHFSGLNHSQSSYDTMYFSWRPWPGQRTLSIDDKRGLCSVYPVQADECAGPGDCPPDEDCLPFEHGTLCAGAPDPVGAPCNYDRDECAQFCLFTATNLSSGYCSRYCDTNADCPLTHHCDVASAGGTPVQVCFAGAQPPPDAGVGACTTDDECPVGQHCDVAASACTFECRSNADCGGATCDVRGQCADAGGCGCRTERGGGGWGALAVLLVTARRRRRRARSRCTRSEP